MRFLSLTILAGVLSLGAAALEGSLLSNTQASDSSNIEQIAQNNGRTNTVHRGSGRRQILAISTPSVR